MLKFLAPALLFATTATAQFIDYDQLFADKVDQLTERTLSNGQTVTDLRLENSVVVTRDANGKYVSFATSGNAPGCYFEILTALRAVAQTCPATFGVNRAQNLSEMVTAFSAYMARNAYPPLSDQDVAKITATKIQNAASKHAKSLTCDPNQNPAIDDWLKMTDKLASPEALQAVESLPDMLPVINPCL